MYEHEFLSLSGLIVLGSPLALLGTLGLTTLFRRPLSERTTALLTSVCVSVGLLASCCVLITMLATGRRLVTIELGRWVSLPEENFHFHLQFIFDRLSVPFAMLSFVLVGTIGAFANRYLHREKGYNRFFFLYALFLVGMVLASLAGTIESLFVGWELVGLSSALLVAYFQERPAPVINGFRIWTIYRIADAAFLLAAVALHHFTGVGDFSALTGRESWPDGVSTILPQQALIVGVLLLIAAAGKSGLVPLTSWLPRAMEGPTPSSAVFYGALSVHLGAFLLLRVSPLLANSPWLAGAVVTIGLATAVFGAIAGRVQSDVKTGLAFASATQVGIITAEIGLGLRYIPLIHIIGHACLRTLQLLRAPTLLRDYHAMEDAIGGRLKPAGRESAPDKWIGLYRFALARGGFDAWMDRLLVRPFVSVFSLCNRLEQRWTTLLTGPPAPRVTAAVVHRESAPEIAATQEDAA